MRLFAVLLRETRYWERYVQSEINKWAVSSVHRKYRGWCDTKIVEWFNYGENRPWTDDFRKENLADNRKRIHVEPIKDWIIFKGDRVQILVGKDKGKQGIVNCLIKERNWCYVEGLNCDFEMQSLHKSLPKQCSKKQRPLLVTDQVQLVDPSDEEPTDVEWRFTETGQKVRVSKRTGRIIPLPALAQETDDFILPSSYRASKKDTSQSDLLKKTFVPVLKTFESDIMDQMGIVENRKRAKTYWY